MLKLTPESTKTRGIILQFVAFAACIAYLYVTAKVVPVPAQCVEYDNQRNDVLNSSANKLLLVYGFIIVVVGFNILISAALSAWKKTRQLQAIQKQQEQEN